MGPELTGRQRANKKEVSVVLNKQVLEQAARGAGWDGKQVLKFPSDMSKISPHFSELVRGLSFLMRHQEGYNENDLKQEGKDGFEAVRSFPSPQLEKALKKVQPLFPSARVEQFVDLFLNRREEITVPVPSFKIVGARMTEEFSPYLK